MLIPLSKAQLCKIQINHKMACLKKRNFHFWGHAMGTLCEELLQKLIGKLGLESSLTKQHYNL